MERVKGGDVGTLRLDQREGRIRVGAPIMDAPFLSITEVFSDSLEALVVDLSRVGREFGKGDKGVANIGAAGNVGV